VELFCAVDVLQGRAVRLVRGDFERAEDFGDPLEIARGFLDAGAQWLHVVDLDAARTGARANTAALEALVDLAHGDGARIEIAGGLRTADDVEAALERGADRVVLGTAAAAEPAFALCCAQSNPGRVAVAVDYRHGASGREVVVDGWTSTRSEGIAELVRSLASDATDAGDAGIGRLAALVVTAVQRDGTLEGPDLDGLGAVLDLTSAPVVASGGVGSAGDLRRLVALRSAARGRRPAGVVVGRALVDGTMRVEEAIAACEASE
jgi:phosphoribosylformimino-5-aminoimidazole carboxamide ribotide isomerase